VEEEVFLFPVHKIFTPISEQAFAFRGRLWYDNEEEEGKYPSLFAKNVVFGHSTFLKSQEKLLSRSFSCGVKGQSPLHSLRILSSPHFI